MPQSGKQQNELVRLREVRDEDINYTDISETSDDWFKTAELALELTSKRPKEKISMLIDHEVLDFFKQSGTGYQTRMNAVLKGYVWENKQQARRQPVEA